MGLEDHEKDFTTEEHFDNHFMNLAMQWQELGIHPDDMLTCALCREFMFDPDKDFEPRSHCANTTYIIRTASGLDYGRVKPGQGGFIVADKIAQEIRGRLFGIDLFGNEIRIAFYDLVPPKE